MKLDRVFKRAIAALTALVVVGLVVGSPAGRYAGSAAAEWMRWAVSQPLGLERPREEIDALWRARRELGVVETRKAVQRMFDTSERPFQDLLRAVGMAPDEAVIRWGNFDRTLMLSGQVFQPDEHGRSYRLRPNTRAVWLRQITLKDRLNIQFLVPDTPEVQKSIPGTTAIVVTESVQTTNSWGCRGPEPNSSAAVRGIVLGDSYMQGMMVGDQDTPPSCLERYLQQEWKAPVSILNTGHLGYSPEQYYFTLRDYCDRFQPHFVVLAIFANDVGEMYEALHGKGDWEEARYWVGEIQQYCRARSILCIVTPIPLEVQIISSRHALDYQGHVSDLCQCSSLHFVDPIDDFVNEHLRLVQEGRKQGKGPTTSPLYNGQIADGHFSALGSDLWARAIGQRITLLISPGSSESVRKVGTSHQRPAPL